MSHILCSAQKTVKRERFEKRRTSTSQHDCMKCQEAHKKDKNTKRKKGVNLYKYVWDKRRIQYISGEENNNEHFRKLKSLANIYVYMDFFQVSRNYYYLCLNGECVHMILFLRYKFWFFCSCDQLLPLSKLLTNCIEIVVCNEFFQIDKNI